MADVVVTRLRRIGSSLGVIIPKQHIQNAKAGEKVEIALLRHRSLQEIQEGLGMARSFTEPFRRDKKTREFSS